MLAASGEHFGVTSFRPSVIFGPGDSLFSRFARLLRLSPGVFPLPTPGARFRPVYVNDVADAFVRSLDERGSFGRTYELCGPQTYTLKALLEYTAEISGHGRLILGLPDSLSRLQARVLGLMPGKPYNYDNYLSSSVPNVCETDGLAELGISATAVEAVVPGYLAAFSARRRYDLFRKAARRD